MKKNKIKYYTKILLKFLAVFLLISLFFTPTINELYEVYAHNHSLHCTAKHENHLHKNHNIFLYNITIANDYLYTKKLNVNFLITSKISINNLLPINIKLNKRLIIFFLRPPPIFI